MISPRRALTVGLALLALTTGIAGCSSSDEAQPVRSKGANAASSIDDAPQPGPGKTLARVTGPDHLLLTVTGVQRSGAGRILTVAGTITNYGKTPYTHTGNWGRGQTDTRDLARNPRSVSGATLTHETTMKRYFVLRDTEGGCLCTTKIDTIEPGEAAVWAAQFPVPPEDAPSEVGLHLPSFPVASFRLGR